MREGKSGRGKGKKGREKGKGDEREGTRGKREGRRGKILLSNKNKDQKIQNSVFGSVF